MTAEFVEADEKTMPQGHLAADLHFTDYDWVVYDVDVYSYQRILALLQEGCGQKPLHLGTYSRQWGHLITHKKIWYGKD